MSSNERTHGAGNTSAGHPNALSPLNAPNPAQAPRRPTRQTPLPIALFNNINSAAITDNEASLQPTPKGSAAPSAATTPGRQRRTPRPTDKVMADLTQKLQVLKDAGKSSIKPLLSGASSTRTTPASGPSTRPPSPPPLNLDDHTRLPYSDSPCNNSGPSAANTPGRRAHKAWSKYGDKEVVDPKTILKLTKPRRKTLTPKTPPRANNMHQHNIYYEDAFTAHGMQSTMQRQQRPASVLSATVDPYQPRTTPTRHRLLNNGTMDHDLVCNEQMYEDGIGMSQPRVLPMYESWREEDEHDLDAGAATLSMLHKAQPTHHIHANTTTGLQLLSLSGAASIAAEVSSIKSGMGGLGLLLAAAPEAATEDEVMAAKHLIFFNNPHNYNDNDHNTYNYQSLTPAPQDANNGPQPTMPWSHNQSYGGKQESPLKAPRSSLRDQARHLRQPYHKATKQHINTPAQASQKASGVPPFPLQPKPYVPSPAMLNGGLFPMPISTFPTTGMGSSLASALWAEGATAAGHMNGMDYKGKRRAASSPTPRHDMYMQHALMQHDEPQVTQPGKRARVMTAKAAAMHEQDSELDHYLCTAPKYQPPQVQQMEEPISAYHPGKADPKPTTRKGRGGKKAGARKGAKKA